jgi:hypothetical protein
LVLVSLSRSLGLVLYGMIHLYAIRLVRGLPFMVDVLSHPIMQVIWLVQTYPHNLIQQGWQNYCKRVDIHRKDPNCLFPASKCSQFRFPSHCLLSSCANHIFCAVGLVGRRKTPSKCVICLLLI